MRNVANMILRVHCILLDEEGLHPEAVIRNALKVIEQNP